LIEAGLEPDIVCRTSIGSLVGAAYVAGRLGELRQWAVTATWREVAGLIDVRLSGSGLTDGKLIVAFLRELGITEAIESFKAICCYRHRSGEWTRDMAAAGPIDEAVRASISLPGIFTPARIGDK
jgi:NTE family protein